MVETVIKTFKLNFDGTFDEVAYEHIKEVFTIVNILAIYITKIKTMYIWIGRNATQALKNHIPNIRVIMKDEFPQFRIIRNITFDMRSEPLEFFNNLNLSKNELYEIINYQEKTVIPILEKVDDLKDKSDKLIKSEQYKDAINLLKEIIELAKKVQDDALVTEQKRLISELTEKYENEKIVSEIEKETAILENEYNNLIKSKRLLDAHNLIETFIKKYETIYDLSLIPSAKELVLKEKRKWNSEQEKIINDLLILEKELTSSLEDLDISKATVIFKKGRNLLADLIDEKITNRWSQFKIKIGDVKKKLDFIEKFEFFSKETVKLKEGHQYEELKSKVNELIKSGEEIDLPEYRSKLNILLNEVDYAEKLYKTILDDIANLEKLILDNQKNDRIEENLIECEKIIEFARSISTQDKIDQYFKVLEETKVKIEKKRIFEENQRKLEQKLSKLEESFILSLKTMEIKKLNNIIENGANLLSELIDDVIKKKWKDYKAKFIATKNLLENIKRLSEKGMDALYSGSCSDSLESFEQITIQLQEYKN